MAFFATVERLPAVRRVWNKPGPKDPDPPVTPPPKPPKPKPSHHCTDGYKRVKVMLYGQFAGYTCEGPPHTYFGHRGSVQTEEQLTGRSVSLAKPLLISADRSTKAKHQASGFTTTKTTLYVNDNVEDN